MLLLPLEGSSDIVFKTLSDLPIANGYVRVVVGGRGSYIEFSDEQIIKTSIFIPCKCGESLLPTKRSKLC